MQFKIVLHRNTAVWYYFIRRIFQMVAINLAFVGFISTVIKYLFQS